MIADPLCNTTAKVVFDYVERWKQSHEYNGQLEGLLAAPVIFFIYIECLQERAH